MKELSLKLSQGNSKLPKSTAIFNMGSATTCPSKALGLCKLNEKCYARKIERIYKNVLTHRNYQQELWLQIDAETFVEWFLLQSTRRTITLRFNESGDFHSQDCVDKAEKIATLLLSEGVAVYAYTHRLDLDFSCVKNLVLNISLDNDNLEDYNEKKEYLERFNKFYRSKDDEQLIANSYTCVGDCKVCSLCTVNHSKITRVKMH